MTPTCIVCGYQPDVAYNDCKNNQPYKATAFYTRGHYGSTFFDPMNGSMLEINVCDDCLSKALDNNQILYYNTDKTAEIYTREKHEGHS